MALGYENTGTGPKLIANAGNAMAESIRMTGEQIRKDILSYNTDKQVAGMLSEVQNVSPDSPTFQNDLIGVLAKYPMAANDPRAKMGLQLLGNAWKQKMREKELETQFGRQKTIAGIKASGGGLYGQGEDPVLKPFAPPGGLRSFDQNPMPPPEGGVSFGAGMGGLGQRTHPTGVNPQLTTETPSEVNDQAGVLFGKVDPLRQALTREGVPLKLGKAKVAQALTEEFNRGQRGTKPSGRIIDGSYYDTSTGTPKLLVQRDPKSKGIFMSEDGPVQLLDNNQWKLPDGTLSDTAPAGVTRIPGAMDERNAEFREDQADVRETARKEATMAKAENAEMTRAIAQIKSKRAVVERDRAAKIQTIEKFEKEGKKAPPENYEVLKKLTASLKTHDDLIDEIRGAKDTTAGDEKVTVVKDGKRYRLPKSQLEDAKKEGYSLAP